MPKLSSCDFDWGLRLSAATSCHSSAGQYWAFVAGIGCRNKYCGLAQPFRAIHEAFRCGVEVFQQTLKALKTRYISLVCMRKYYSLSRGCVLAAAADYV
ncbi:hypothetical protein BaRGS_00040211 [Batillaria attramentaria]|uniref:Uncharacterized protein n=1 Tax=Batillaria attramentaria TaxID=370345 RepID=A0ABD0J1I7_9CAEN